jgi:hypothetical protein
MDGAVKLSRSLKTFYRQRGLKFFNQGPKYYGIPVKKISQNALSMAEALLTKLNDDILNISRLL